MYCTLNRLPTYPTQHAKRYNFQSLAICLQLASCASTTGDYWYLVGSNRIHTERSSFCESSAHWRPGFQKCVRGLAHRLPACGYQDIVLVSYVEHCHSKWELSEIEALRNQRIKGPMRKMLQLLSHKYFLGPVPLNNAIHMLGEIIILSEIITTLFSCGFINCLDFVFCLKDLFYRRNTNYP
jgi:hypothetical protein